jgi:hypothetical protein
VLTKAEQVWRHLLVGSFEENRRRWQSVSALAHEVGVAASTARSALAYPSEIGAVVLRGVGEVRVLDPGRLLMAWAGRRRLSRDVRRRVWLSAPAPEVEAGIDDPAAVLGGFGAVVARIGGNTIADYETVLVYGDPALKDFKVPAEGARRTEVILLEPDPVLADYGCTTPLAQAWVDLFNLPCWQAARFVHHLIPRLVIEPATGPLPV